MIEQIEVDGVPALYSPASGPIRAGLVFRAGVVDESLPRRGITHLIEHFALHGAGVAHEHGSTGVEDTRFQRQGTESEIVTFLAGVCSSLLEPPIYRLATEKKILRTEASSRRADARERMPKWRHGARDYGLSSYPEWGVDGLTAADVREWVARYFVRQNAVLWIAGPSVPAGLRLALPDGTRQPLPPASSALPARPAYFSGSPAGAVWDAVVRREPAAEVFGGVLERELVRSLRQDGGLSTTAGVGYQPRGDGTAVLTAVADGAADQQGAVLGVLLDVLAAMRIGRIDPAEVTAVLDQRCADLAHAGQRGLRLPAEAAGLLTGRPVRGLEEAVADTRAVTHGDVVRVAAAAYADGLLQTPGRNTADWAGFAAAPTSSAFAVAGRAFPAVENPRVRLVVGDQGVSTVDDEHGRCLTVRFDACAALLAWPGGARRLIGADATDLSIEPSRYRDAADALAAVDARVPAPLHVAMPARDPQRLPQSGPGAGLAPAATAAARPAPTGRVGPIVALIVLSPVTVIALLFAITALATANGPGGDPVGTVVVAVPCLLVTAGCVAGGWWAVHRLRR